MFTYTYNTTEFIHIFKNTLEIQKVKVSLYSPFLKCQTLEYSVCSNMYYQIYTNRHYIRPILKLSSYRPT